MKTKHYSEITKVLKSYKQALQANNYNQKKEEGNKKPQSKSLRKENRPMKARDNLKRPIPKEDKYNEKF